MSEIHSSLNMCVWTSMTVMGSGPLLLFLARRGGAAAPSGEDRVPRRALSIELQQGSAIQALVVAAACRRQFSLGLVRRGGGALRGPLAGGGAWPAGAAGLGAAAARGRASTSAAQRPFASLYQRWPISHSSVSALARIGWFGTASLCQSRQNLRMS